MHDQLDPAGGVRLVPLAQLIIKAFTPDKLIVEFSCQMLVVRLYLKLNKF